jgi:hypothetical protein
MFRYLSATLIILVAGILIGLSIMATEPLQTKNWV